VLFNDRFGMHRLYYHESPDAWYFAAEAKAICAICRVRRECLTFALRTGQHHGIWGGTTEDERAAASRMTPASRL